MITVNQKYRGDNVPDSVPKFERGQLVRHRRYGYRGVVVSVDGNCHADPTWYMANKTQPDRGQPWYHVLVDGSSTCTYAAEGNLIADQSGQPIDHPFVEAFFLRFEDGQYLRNDVEWPG